MKKILFILLFLISFALKSQTVIEMMSPHDADIILLRTEDSTKADVVVYLTNKKDEYGQWNCSWKMKRWGFSNFSVFIASDTAQLVLDPDDFIEENCSDSTVFVKPHGTVYFTTNPSYKGYKDPSFKLPGVMRITRKQPTESKK